MGGAAWHGPAGGLDFSELPYSLYTKSEFWLESPAQVRMKLGVMLSIFALRVHLDPLCSQYGLERGESVGYEQYSGRRADGGSDCLDAGARGAENVG
jgi:hypothetical protein